MGERHHIRVRAPACATPTAACQHAQQRRQQARPPLLPSRHALCGLLSPESPRRNRLPSRLCCCSARSRVHVDETHRRMRRGVLQEHSDRGVLRCMRTQSACRMLQTNPCSCACNGGHMLVCDCACAMRRTRPPAAAGCLLPRRPSGVPAPLLCCGRLAAAGGLRAAAAGTPRSRMCGGTPAAAAPTRCFRLLCCCCCWCLQGRKRSTQATLIMRRPAAPAAATAAAGAPGPDRPSVLLAVVVWRAQRCKPQKIKSWVVQCPRDLWV
jgi:hypothetical protein